MPALPIRDLPAGLEALAELALDLRWTWSHEADALWERIDAEAWNRTRNPWTILQDISHERLRALAADNAFVAEVERLAAARQAYLEAPSWFLSTHGVAALSGVAYFSMEFGLGEGLPLYAGGLGILAGDFLKTASDLGIPVIGIGLLYQEGYFRQLIDAAGAQHEAYPYNDPGSLPIQPARDADGGWLHIHLDLPGRAVALRVWQALVGRVRLYLLDANAPFNNAADRGITGKLYDAGSEIRILQEIVLGVAGWRTVEALAPEVEICHLNEGHAAFAILERIRATMRRSGLSFWEAYVGDTRRQFVHDAHSGGGRLRPVLARAVCQICALSRRLPRRSRDPAGRARRVGPGWPQRWERAVQHGVSRTARLDAQFWRQPAARSGQPTALPTVVSALAGTRGARRPRHQWSACSELGFAACRPVVDRRLRQGALARDARDIACVGFGAHR